MNFSFGRILRKVYLEMNLNIINEKKEKKNGLIIIIIIIFF